MAMVIAATTTQAVLVTVAAFSSGWMGWMTMYSSPDSTADTPAARVSADVVMVMSVSSVMVPESFRQAAEHGPKSADESWGGNFADSTW